MVYFSSTVSVAIDLAVLGVDERDLLAFAGAGSLRPDRVDSVIGIGQKVPSASRRSSHTPRQSALRHEAATAA